MNDFEMQILMLPKNTQSDVA